MTVNNDDLIVAVRICNRNSISLTDIIRHFQLPVTESIAVNTTLNAINKMMEQ